MLHIFKYIFVLITFLLFNVTIAAQNSKSGIIKKELSLGLNYGQAAQEYFPYYNENYLYESKYFKGQINYLLLQKNKFSLELLVEPGFYQVQYRLLNWYFVQENRGDDFIEQRFEYIQMRTFNEFALNFGLVTRFNIFKNFSTYLMASVGPMNSGKHTERLIKGFAFSDIVGYGVSYRLNRFIFDSRLTLRHTSNANTRFPNNGHNSMGLEAGVSFVL